MHMRSVSGRQRQEYMRALGRRGGQRTVERRGQDWMRQIGHAGYVAAVAAGWSDYVQARLQAWNQRYATAWWQVMRPEWRSLGQLMDALREGLCDWPECDREGTIEVGRARICWTHYCQARQDREGRGEMYHCYGCGQVTPTAELGGLVGGHEFCVTCLAPDRLRAYWTR